MKFGGGVGVADWQGRGEEVRKELEFLDFVENLYLF